MLSFKRKTSLNKHLLHTFNLEMLAGKLGRKLEACAPNDWKREATKFQKRIKTRTHK